MKKPADDTHMRSLPDKCSVRGKTAVFLIAGHKRRSESIESHMRSLRCRNALIWPSFLSKGAPGNVPFNKSAEDGKWLQPAPCLLDLCCKCILPPRYLSKSTTIGEAQETECIWVRCVQKKYCAMVWVTDSFGNISKPSCTYLFKSKILLYAILDMFYPFYFFLFWEYNKTFYQPFKMEAYLDCKSFFIELERQGRVLTLIVSISAPKGPYNMTSMS